MDYSSDKSGVQSHDRSNSDDDNVILPKLSTIWDCKKIQVHTSQSGKVKWKCDWCGSIFVNKNATKAVGHLICAQRKGIKICTRLIPKPYMD